METIGEDLRQMIRTPLSRSHVEALRAAGKVVTYPKGTIMAQPGEKANRFVYVEEGEIEVGDQGMLIVERHKRAGRGFPPK